jgi:hypothetical protein
LQKLNSIKERLGFLEFEAQNKRRFETRFSNENLQDYPLMVRVWISGSKLGPGVPNSEQKWWYL